MLDSRETIVIELKNRVVWSYTPSSFLRFVIMLWTVFVSQVIIYKIHIATILSPSLPLFNKQQN